MTTASSSDNLFADLAKSAEADTVEPVVPDVEDEAAPAPVTELDMLKNRARLMGITFSNNIGLDALKGRIQAKLDGEAEQAEEPEMKTELEKTPTKSKAQLAQEEREQMIAEQMRLVRLRITNLNPAKKDLPGEIITFANRVLGAVRKFIPFGEATENGYHVPYCLYQQLKDREFLNIKTRKDSRGRTIIESNMAREFALEVLDPLTTVELARLAAAQSAASGMD